VCENVVGDGGEPCFSSVQFSLIYFCLVDCFFLGVIVTFVDTMWGSSMFG